MPRDARGWIVVALALGLAACGTRCGGGGDDGPRDGAGTDGGATGDGGTTGDGGAAVDAAPQPMREVHLIGRWDMTGANPRASFPGSAIVARFMGTGISVRLDGAANQWAVVVDGGAPTLLKTASGAQTYPLAQGLAAGLHTVELHRRTESFFGNVSYLGLTVQGGALVASPAPWARRIEFVGDSITCGYGNEGASASCPFSADTENEYLAYGAVTARRLSAAHTAICYSGKGVYRNYGMNLDEPMPVIWPRALADLATPAWDFSREVPDVVVINLGTNDFSGGDPGQPFVTAMTTFVGAVRAKYPQAEIVLALGSMLSGAELTSARGYLTGVVAARNGAGDTKVSFVDLGVQQQADGIGCDWHPSVATHAKMADRLVTHLRAHTGW